MSLLPAKCPECFGEGARADGSVCPRCGGTELVAVELPDSGPMFTRRCPACGETNGMYFPRPDRDPIPVDGAPVQEGDSLMSTTHCLWCADHAQMVWERVDREDQP